MIIISLPVLLARPILENLIHCREPLAHLVKLRKLVAVHGLRKSCFGGKEKVARVGDWIWLLVIGILFFPYTGITKTWTKYFMRVAEMNAKLNDAVLKEIKAVRQELIEHKNEVHEFQLGLDNRIDGIEIRIVKIEAVNREPIVRYSNAENVTSEDIPNILTR